jgi:hypothetical protein
MYMDHLFYGRHFVLLTCLSVLLAVMTRQHFLIDLSGSFALYGALHASALVLTLRARQPIWRMCLFIALAAGLCFVTLRAGMFEGRLVGALPGNAGLYAVLGFSALTGAVTYGIAIHLFGIYKMSLRSLAVISASCLLATYVAFFTLTNIHALGRWWLPVLWWFAFSGGLWYCDQRQKRRLMGN